MIIEITYNKEYTTKKEFTSYQEAIQYCENWRQKDEWEFYQKNFYLVIKSYEINPITNQPYHRDAFDYFFRGGALLNLLNVLNGRIN